MGGAGRSLMLLVGGTVVAAYHGVLHLLDVGDGRAREVRHGLPDGVWRSIAGARGDVVVVTTNRLPLELALCDVAAGRVVARVRQSGTADLTAEGDEVALAALPSAVWVYHDGRPLLVELHRGAGLALHELPWLEGAERGFRVHAPAGARRALVLDGQGYTSLYDVDGRRLVRHLPAFGGLSVHEMLDGSWWLLHTSDPAGVVQVAPDGEVLRRWPAHGPYQLSVEPEGRYAVVKMAGPIVVMDLTTGQQVRKLLTKPWVPDPTQQPVLLPDGSLVFWTPDAGFDVVPVSDQLPV